MQLFPGEKSFLLFHCQDFFNSLSYESAISFTHGLKHWWFLGQTNLYRFCGLWKKSRHIWTNFLVRKRLQYLDVKLEVFKRGYNRNVCLVQNLTMGEPDFNQFMQLRNQQAIPAKTMVEGKFVPSADSNQRHG